MQQSWKPKAIDGVPDGLVLFDGVCVLCSGWVRFLIERDRDQFFRFTPIQSPYGRALAQRLGIDAEAPETNAVIVGGRAYFKADSAIQALARCATLAMGAGLLGSAAAGARLALRPIARNRYQLFGRTESCMVPTPELMRRFVFDEGGATSERASQ